MTRQCLSGRYLWQCGRYAGFERDTDGKLILEGKGKKGIFISRTYDSGISGAEWNRVVLDISSSAVVWAYVYLFDDCKEGEMIDDMDSAEEQYYYLREHAQYTSHYREMLLYGQEQDGGRFARLAVEILTKERNLVNGKGSRSPKALMSGYSISFPKESFTGYLPSIYRDNLQLERFLAVQQSLYLELEQNIDSIARELDFEICGKEQAVILAEWLGWGELAGAVSEDILRRLVKEGVFLNSRKGTGVYYERLAEILTGQKAVLLEEPGSRECTLLIRGEPEEGGEKYFEWIYRNVPIGVRMNIVVLRRTDRLDGKFFLDNTSYLSEYESEITDKGSNVDNLRLM